MTSLTFPDKEEGDLVLADKQVVEKAKDILTCMANAVSAMKIFPSDHATVRGFVDALTEKFDEYFKTYQRLQVGIEEYSFTCAGQVVYTDEMTIKSLPFFFFKDGAQILYFYRGLDRKEIVAFLELIKTVAQKPGGDNDIVAALWESDFSNIQYYAPDEFIENQILAEKRDIASDQDLPELPSDLAHETLEVKVDLSKFSEGRIELKPEDREKFRWGAEGSEEADLSEAGDGAAAPVEPSSVSPDGSHGHGPSPAASMDPNLLEPELEALESMIRANRLLSPEDEFINLTAEVMFLESDLRVCEASLDVLYDFLIEQIGGAGFRVASAVIQKAQELEASLRPTAPEKVALIQVALSKMKGPKTLEAVEGLLAQTSSVDWVSLLELFRLIGPTTLPTAAGLYEKQRGPEVREKILSFIKEMCGADPKVLVNLANDSRPALSREVIALLASMPGPKGVTQLGAFLMFKSRDLKLEVIHALGRRHDDDAGRILMGFLNDPDEDLRIQAALKLNPTEEVSRIRHVIKEASTPAFRKKSLKEKEALLSFLGRTRSAEALEFLSGVLRRTTFWPSASNTEMRLAAVAGLESMGTAESAGVLEEGLRGRGRKVRAACAEALARLTIPPQSARG